MICPTSILLAFAIAPLASAVGVRWLFSEEVKTNAELELLKKSEIARMRALILDELGLKKIPAVHNSTRSLPDSVLQLLIAESEPPVQTQTNMAWLIIFPSNGDFRCKRHDSPSCRRFQYEITSGAMYYTTEFWFLKLLSSTTKKPTLSVLCSHLGKEHQVIEQDDLPQNAKDNEWNSFHLTELKQLSLWKGNLSCSVEVVDIAVSENGRSRPFLRMLQDLDAHARARRSIKTPEPNDTCKTVSFTVAFDDIGFGRYIVHPKSYEANLCAGYCLQAQTMHETVVDLAFQKNASLEREHGRCWSTCCKPKTYTALRLIHSNIEKDGTETVIDRYIPNMVVESCWCN